MYRSVFYSDRVLRNIRKNCDQIEGCQKLKEQHVKNAEYWMNLSYDELWGLIFDPNLERSWMVNSGGICPTCKDKVVMYDWIIDAKNNPWKLKCPKCGELFPKNDFKAYYESGLTKTGRFSYGKADQSLLYNEESGDRNNKLGVDLGFGYKEGDTTWRFIPTYLLYGQWMQLILGGINALSIAYVYTEIKEYARRTLILLDRLADFWPLYDYNNQGWMYEELNVSVGYISYGVNGAFEACCLAESYDRVARELYNDDFLVKYIADKPSISKQENIKRCAGDIRDNIENRIIKDYLEHPIKLSSNYPYTERALAVGKAVLNWWDEKDSVLDEVFEIVKRTTLYDGMTGESSTAGYATMGKHGMASMLSLFLQADPDLIEKAYKKTPAIYDAYRFHIDVHCVDKYYPTIGDDSYFCLPREKYPNSDGVENLVIWKLYQLTKDADLLKVLVRDNGGTSEGLFNQFTFVKDIGPIEKQIGDIVEKEGIDINVGSIKKDNWEIAILRSGQGENKRAVWFNFGFNKTSHCHGDAMTFGMYYKGADIMTELGYPNVAYGGGWYSKQAAWTTGTISHNVVTYQRQRQRRGKGNMTLWCVDDDFFRVARANAPGIIKGSDKYERTLAFIEIDDQDSYLIDVFRVKGRKGHYEKYTRACTGKLILNGLDLIDDHLEFPEDVFMKDFKKVVINENNWTMDLEIEDVLDVFPEPVHWKYKSFTNNETIHIASSWVPPSMNMLGKGHNGYWMPAIISGKSATDNETITFVSVMEPYINNSKIKRIVRLDSGRDENVVIHTEFCDGAFDVVILKDPAVDLNDIHIDSKVNIKTDSEACIIRFSQKGDVLKVKNCKGTYVDICDFGG